MTRSWSAGNVGDDLGFGERQPYLTSYRAVAACTREFARLSDELARLSDQLAAGVAAMPGETRGDEATVRQSPARCIVQLGPVALTVAWLRNAHDSVATGDLLVIVWRGAVAPQRTHEPERPSRGRTRSGATPLWEQVFAAAGDSEASWGWEPREADAGRWSSNELAAHCMERLRAAYADCPSAA